LFVRDISTQEICARGCGPSIDDGLSQAGPVFSRPFSEYPQPQFEWWTGPVEERPFMAA